MDFQQLLKQAGVLLKWVLMGVMLGLMLSQYDGRIDIRLERSGTHLIIEGSPQEQCDVQQF